MTNFFSQLSELIADGTTVTISTTKTAHGLKVSVLVKNKSVEDPAAKKIVPIICKGQATEIDAQFFYALKEPIKESSELLVNMSRYADSVKTADAQSQAQKDIADKKKKLIDKNNKKFDENKKKFDEFIESKDAENAEKYLIVTKNLSPDLSAKNIHTIEDMEAKYDEIAPNQVSMFDIPGVIEETTKFVPPIQENKPVANVEVKPEIKSGNSMSAISDDEIDAIQEEYDQKFNEQSGELSYIPDVY